MIQKYFLTNGVEYLPHHRELKIQGKLTGLPHLENVLLYYFVTHPNQVISKETLYKIGWAGRICDDNPLSKAISNLRAKLKDDHRAPRYIKTVHKQGFKFIADVSCCAQENTYLTMRIKAASMFSKHLIPLLLMLLIIIIAGIFNPFIQDYKPVVSNIHQLTNTPSQEKFPDISSDLKNVVFSRQLTEYSNAQLIIKPLSGGEEITLTSAPYHHSNPKWHSNAKQLLYRRYDQHQCEIVLLSLNSELKVIKQKVVVNCQQFQSKFGLSWASNNQFYYTDTKRQDQGSNIYLFNLDTNLTSLFSRTASPVDFGFYQLHYDPKSEQLFSLYQSKDNQTMMMAFAPSGKPLYQNLIDWPIYSITSYQGEPVYRTSQNHIDSHSKTGFFRLLHSLGWPIAYPTMSTAKKPTLVFVNSELNNSAMIKTDLQNNSEQQLLSPGHSHKLPFYVPSGALYYLSNNNGLIQLWKSHNNHSQPVSQFRRHLGILSFSVSDDENHLVLTTAKAVLLFNLNLRPLSTTKASLTLPNYLNPHFSPNSKTLWASTFHRNRYEMHAFELAAPKKKQPNQIIAYGYLGLFDKKTAEHFAFKYAQPGIWKVKDNRLYWYSDAPNIDKSPRLHLFDHQLDYYNDHNKQIMRWSLDSGENIKLISTKHRDFSAIVSDKTQQPHQFALTKPQFSHSNIYLVVYD